MIHVDAITIKEFRGIRNLTLVFNSTNFAICGPNGTGKSGVVDALEFAFTGAVSRLSGKGRGDISLKEHGPHVDKRNNPDEASVSVKITIPNLHKTVTIERSVRSPMTAKMTPMDDDVMKILKHVQQHPEIVLSRRELIRYVLATPGERAQEVQALLRLEPLEQVRRGLQALANASERHLAPLIAATKGARESLLRAMGVTELTSEKVLAAANLQREALGMAPLLTLTETTSLKDGMTTVGQNPLNRLVKTHAQADVKAFREILAEISSLSTLARVDEITRLAKTLIGNPVINARMTRERFYKTGMDLIEHEYCPFCDTQWDMEALRIHVSRKLAHLKEVSESLTELDRKIAPLIGMLQRLATAVERVALHGGRTQPVVSMDAVTGYAAACAAKSRQLMESLPVADTIAILAGLTEMPKDVVTSIDNLDAHISGLPEPSKQEGSREWLTLAQERLEVWREARRKQKAASVRAEISRKVFDTYTKTSDEVLTGLYAAVEKDFGAFYRFINRDDEAEFQARLVPSMGKLGFDVDFYGRGYFPPGAYHSEGHQDGMGLCLYLALMRYLQRDNFNFAVLDDVLMSVDAGHRREVCALLKKEFPKTQFIMTTHDPIWLRHMRTEGLTSAKGGIQFRSWNVDYGPTQWDERDVWSEVDDATKTNDVRNGAGILRHYLEYMAAELCNRLRAPVEYRGDAQYQLGELLPSAIRRMRSLYASAKKAANSWNQKELVAQIAAIDSEFSKLAAASLAEQWQVNSAIHYNSWDNLGQHDFEPVVAAFKNLLSGFNCAICREPLRVSPERELADSLRCECGQTNFNLREKDK